MNEELLIGVAEESITPEGSISLAGQFFERISEYVETPVVATAMAVKKGEEQMVILTFDLTSIGDTLIRGVKKRIGDLEGFDPDKLIVNATHSHTSHVYTRDPAESRNGAAILAKLIGEDKQYKALTGDKKPSMNAKEALEYLSEKGAEAVRKAWKKLHPATLSFSYGRAAVGMNRRVCYDDGTAKMWGDTNLANFKELEAGNDDGIEMGFITGENDKLEGVFLNVACPSQVVEHRSFVSSDYWGKVRILLREKFGEDLVVIGLCSAAGDLCPRDLIRWVNPETPIDDPNIRRPDYIERRADPSMFDIKGTWKIGKRIVNEVLDAFEERQALPSDAIFRHEVIKTDLPYRKVTITEYENAIKAIQEFAKTCEGSFTFEDNARMHVYAGTAARYESQQNKELVPVEIHIVRLGDVAFATNPFELFLNYGNQIRARSRAKQTFLIQLACGSYGYLPTEKAEKGSHYSAYVSSGHVGHAGGELLVRKSISAINDLFQK